MVRILDCFLYAFAESAGMYIRIRIVMRRAKPNMGG